jgi:ABC-type antimicrobial peptide transport system permease subunit
LSAIENIWSQQHPDQIFEYEFLDQSIARFYDTEEAMLKLVQVFSFIAIFIGSLGLYGLVSFMVSQKTKEIGIRKVLGSSVRQIVWIFGKEFSRLIALAFLISCPVAWYVMNDWLQNFKYRIDIGVSIFVMAILSSFVIATLTVIYQTTKAALMNPVNSLRSE